MRLPLSPDQDREPLRRSAVPSAKAERLYSWKEIAAYLRHGVRTVQRWEAEGLPVHRHPHEKRDSVYAYPAELDAWWTSRQARLEQGEKIDAPGSRTAPAVREVAKAARRRLWTVLAGVALATAAVVSWWYLHSASRSGRVSALGGRLTLLISSAGPIYDPAISADGKMIVYVAEAQGQADLFVSRTSGGERVRLTNDLAGEANPRFSPDGERIVFDRLGSEAGGTEIRVIPTLGGPSSRLVPDALQAAWSPDGARVAFVSRRRGEPDNLAIVASDGTDLRIVMRGDADYPFFRPPAWSPDGATLAVERSSGGFASELWLVPLSGRSPRRLSNDAPGIFGRYPVFTPDGRSLIHQSNRGGALNLWRLPLRGGPAAPLTTGPGPDESPTVTRDGLILFESSHERCTLIVHELTSGQTRELLAHASFIWAPAFSPDGRELAFSRAEPDGSWHVWIAPVQGGRARRLTSGAIPEVYPRFSPDGAWVTYHTWQAGAGRIWRVPRGGGSPEALTPLRDEDDSFGDLSPDGHRLAFARTEKQSTHVYVASLTGGAARRLTESPSTLPRWSPDGRWIAFSPSRSFTGGIFIIGADGANMRRLTETGSFPVWHPDGKRVAYIDLGPDGMQRILVVPVEGGPSKPLGKIRFQGANNPFDVSPDGKLLASSSVVSLSSEIWLLEPRR